MEGMLIVQSDNWLNLIKRNFPQSNVARPNKSKVVTVTVFGNFYEEKKYRLSTHQSYQLFVTFPPKKMRLSLAKNINSPSVCDKNKSLQLSDLRSESSVNIPPENSLLPCEWRSQTASYLLMAIMLFCHLARKT